MKRAFDLVLSVPAVIVLSPILVLLALAVLLSSGLPVLFHHERVGHRGKPFTLIKFRTMVFNPQASGSWSTSKNDSRVTPIGRFLRATSLDELPQLWNIIRGDMSVVGPRPDVPQQRDLYSAEEWSIRNSVKPGLTGLAQCTMRSDATPEQRKALDLDYVQKQSLGFDLWILGQTVKQVLMRGSY